MVDFPWIKIFIPLVAFILIWGLESLRPLFKDRKDRIRHGGRNLLIFFINTAVLWILFSSVNENVLRTSANHSWGLINLTPFQGWLKSLGLIVLFDLWMYIWHRANHEIRFI